MGQRALFAPQDPVWALEGQTPSHCFYFPYILWKALNSGIRGCKWNGHNEFERTACFVSKTVVATLNHVCPTGPHTGWLSREWKFRITTHSFCFHFHKFLTSTTRRPVLYLGGTWQWAYVWHDLPKNKEAAFSRVLPTNTSFFILYVISSFVECFLGFWHWLWKHAHL